MKRVAVALALALGVLIVILGVRTARFTSRQIPAENAAMLPIDTPVAAERLAGALRFRTISPSDPAQRDPAEFAAFHEYLHRQFTRVHSALEREELPNGSVLYSWRGTDSTLAPIVLMAHIDVVPVEPETEGDWTHPPFGGRIAEGFVWGRGAVDDKVGVLGILEAAETLLARGFQPRRTIYLAFGADEEVGGSEGAARIATLLREREIQPEWVLDEGGLIARDMVPGVAAPVALVGIAEKGSVSVELTIEGEGGHSSMPPRATSIGILSRAVNRLQENPLPGGLRGATRDLFAYVGPEMPLGQRLAFANLWLFGPLVERQLAAAPTTDATLRTTTAPTIFQGGIKENVLPSRARAVVNFRILPGDSVAGVLEHVRRTVDDPRVQLRTVGRADDASPISSIDSPSWTMLQRTIRQVFPEAVVAPYLTVGGTDARHFRSLSPNVYRFLPVRTSPEDPAMLHGTDERISIEDYANAVRFYTQLLLNGAGAPSAE